VNFTSALLAYALVAGGLIGGIILALWLLFTHTMILIGIALAVCIVACIVTYTLGASATPTTTPGPYAPRHASANNSVA